MTRFALICLTALAVVGDSSAQEAPSGAGYRVAASTLDGGAPQASSHAPSGYRLSGTIGQPDAATSTSGTVVLEGGFWPASQAQRPARVFSNGFE